MSHFFRNVSSKKADHQKKLKTAQYTVKLSVKKPDNLSDSDKAISDTFDLFLLKYQAAVEGQKNA